MDDPVISQLLVEIKQGIGDLPERLARLLAREEERPVALEAQRPEAVAAGAGAPGKAAWPEPMGPLLWQQLAQWQALGLGRHEPEPGEAEREDELEEVAPARRRRVAWPSEADLAPWAPQPWPPLPGTAEATRGTEPVRAPAPAEEPPAPAEAARETTRSQTTVVHEDWALSAEALREREAFRTAWAEMMPEAVEGGLPYTSMRTARQGLQQYLETGRVPAGLEGSEEKFQELIDAVRQGFRDQGDEDTGGGFGGEEAAAGPGGGRLSLPEFVAAVKELTAAINGLKNPTGHAPNTSAEARPPVSQGQHTPESAAGHGA